MKPICKLRSHTGSVLCCASLASSPHTVVSSSEDGSVRMFDLRTHSCSIRLQLSGGDAVASVCLKPGDDNQLYAAVGNAVHTLELRLGSSDRKLQVYNVNTDEINQVVVNQKATYLATADDSGEIKVIDLNSQKLYKTLRGMHTNICSAVQFHAQKPWEAISGGLDSKIVKWDISKGKHVRIVEPVLPSANGVGQVCNPPFVHALATPGGYQSGEIGRLLAVARGDGAVEVYDSAFDNGKGTKTKARRSGKTKSDNQKGEEEAEVLPPELNGLKRRLSSDDGGHLTSVSSVTFTKFGESGRYLISGGNDGLIKMWDWTSPTLKDGVDGRPLVINIHHRRKINWLSTIDNSNANLIVADTSKVLTLYHVL